MTYSPIVDVCDLNKQWRMPASYLKLFLQQVAAAKLPPQSALKGTGLDPGMLMQSDRTVGLDQILRVLSNISGLLQPGWHLSLAPQMSLSAHGPLGFAVVTAPNLRVAMDTLLRFIGIRGPFLWLAGSVEGDEFVIRVHETVNMGDERRILVELAMLSLQNLVERPLGREIREGGVALAYAPPVYNIWLTDLFHAPVEFGAARHRLSFPAAWLDEPCPMFDEALHRYLLRRCEEDLLKASGQVPDAVAVRQALLTRPGKLPSLAEIAADRHVSPRTLMRRLKRVGTSYQAILEDVRRTLALDYLLRSDMSVARIAYRLGYQDPANFGRAFRRWFGEAPGGYRKRRQSKQPRPAAKSPTPA